MTAQIIDLPSRPHQEHSNGAREALIDIVQMVPEGSVMADAELLSDWLLMELWARGFKLVPLENRGAA